MDAKLLKKKGYNESNDYVYDRCANDGKECIELQNVDFEYRFNDTNSDIDEDIEFTSNICTAPTYHEVVDWLEGKGYVIEALNLCRIATGRIEWRGRVTDVENDYEYGDWALTREAALNAAILKALEMI